jgi:ariadne-1
VEQGRVIAEVAGVLDMPPECARTLLIHFAWAKDKLFDRYYADPKGTRGAAGIAHLGVSAPASGKFMCEICLNPSDGFGLGCRHVFCRDCWAGFLAAAVSDDGANCIFKKCPASGCGEAVTLAVVRAMAPPDVAAKWALYELKHFVTISKDMAWCPGAGCSNAFVARTSVKTAVCSCGTKFCFKCSREAHQPVGCDKLTAWLDKCGSESETANWILANTKRCPRCAVRIEKNQGCNHMRCTNKGCRFEFCWTCLGPWTEHGQSTGGYYKCNKYRGGGGGDDAAGGAAGAPGDAAARAKAELDKYLFYYQRYSNHEAAGRFAAKHREATQKRMEELQAASATSWADVTFLEAATEALLECRRVLKYTYVMGFYMKEGGEKRLFEHLQEHLEQSTEHLAELTEAPLEKVDRPSVVNFTRVTSQFLKNLLQGVEDGLTAVAGAP